jgi:hypothetical protein
MHSIEVVAFRRAPKSPGSSDEATNDAPMFQYKFQRELPHEATSLDFAITHDDVAQQR